MEGSPGNWYVIMGKERIPAVYLFCCRYRDFLPSHIFLPDSKHPYMENAS